MRCQETLALCTETGSFSGSWEMSIPTPSLLEIGCGQGEFPPLGGDLSPSRRARN